MPVFAKLCRLTWNQTQKSDYSHHDSFERSHVDLPVYLWAVTVYEQNILKLTNNFLTINPVFFVPPKSPSNKEHRSVWLSFLRHPHQHIIVTKTWFIHNQSSTDPAKQRCAQVARPRPPLILTNILQFSNYQHRERLAQRRYSRHAPRYCREVTDAK